MVAHHKMSMPFNKWITLHCLSEWRKRQVNLKRCIARKNRNVKVSPTARGRYNCCTNILLPHAHIPHLFKRNLSKPATEREGEKLFSSCEHRETKPTCQRRSRTGRNEDRTGGKRGRGGIVYPATFWQKVKDDTWATERSNEGEWTKAWKEETNKYSLCLVPWCILGSDI